MYNFIWVLTNAQGHCTLPLNHTDNFITLKNSPVKRIWTQLQYVYDRGSPHQQVILRHQLDVLQFNSVLILSIQ